MGSQAEVRPAGPLEVPSQGPWRWAGPRLQRGAGELYVVPGVGGHPGGRGPARGPPTQERDLVRPEPKGTQATAARGRVLSPERQGWEPRTAMSTRLWDRRGGLGAGGAGCPWLGPAAEPWRRAGSGPPPQASDSKGAADHSKAKQACPSHPTPACLLCRAGARCSSARGPTGHPGQKQPPGPHPGEAEAIKGRTRVAGAQPGAKLWVCSVRINCWMKGWMRESRKG